MSGEDRKNKERELLSSFGYRPFLTYNRRLEYFYLDYYYMLDFLFKVYVYNEVNKTGKNLRLAEAVIQTASDPVRGDFLFDDNRYALQLSEINLLCNYNTKDKKTYMQLPVCKNSFSLDRADSTIGNIIGTLDRAGLISNEKIHSAATAVVNNRVNLYEAIKAVNAQLVFNDNVTQETIEEYREKFFGTQVHVYFNDLTDPIKDGLPLHTKTVEVIKEQFAVPLDKYMEDRFPSSTMASLKGHPLFAGKGLFSLGSKHKNKWEGESFTRKTFWIKG